MALAIAASWLCSATGRAAQYIWTAPATSEITDTFSNSTDWSALPVSATSAEITFESTGTGTIFPSNLVDTITDGVSGFSLNILDLGGTGSSSGSGDVINVVAASSGSFSIGGGTNPTVNLVANSGSDGLTYNVSVPIALTATTTFSGNGTATFIFSGAMSGTGGFVKTGGSNMTLSGNQGNISWGSSTTINGGTLTLDYCTNNSTALTGSATNQLISNSTGLNLGGGTLALVPNASAATLAKLGNGLTLTVGTGSTISSAAAVGGTNFALGAITRNSGSAIDFSLPVSYTGGSPTGKLTTTTLNNSAGILGGWATVNGQDWAMESGSTPFSIVPFGSYNTTLPTAGGSGLVNYFLSGGQTQPAGSGATNANSLKIVGDGTLALNNNNFFVSSAGAGGLLYAGGGVTNQYTISSTFSTTGLSAGSGAELLIDAFTGATLTVQSPIRSGTGGSVTKTGGGTLILSSNFNNYTGGTNITGGTLQIGVASALGTGATVVGPGGTLDLNGQTITNSVTLNGSGVGNSGALIDSIATAASLNGGAFNLGSDAAIGGSGNVTLTSSVSSINWNSHNLIKAGADTLNVAHSASSGLASLTVNGGVFQYGISTVLASSSAAVTVNTGATLDLNSFSDTIGGLLTLNSGAITLGGSNGTLTLKNSPSGVALTGTGASAISGGGTSGLTLNSSSTNFNVPNSTDALTISSNISGNSQALVKTGAGTLILSAANGNSYTAGTAINGGAVQVTNTSGSALGTGAVTVASGATLLGSSAAGQGIVGGPVTVSGTISAGNALASSVLTLSANGTGLTMNSGATFAFSLGPPNGANSGTPLINLNGSSSALLLPTTASTVNVALSGSPTAGTYDLLKYLGSAVGSTNFNSLKTPVGPSGFTYALVNNSVNKEIDLTVANAIINGVWTQTAASGSGSPAGWGTAANWSSNPSIPGNAGDSATFGAATTNNQFINLAAATTVGSLTFNNPNAVSAGSGQFTIAGGSGSFALTLNNNGNGVTVTNSTGVNTISAPIVLSDAGGVTLNAAGGAATALTISGPISGNSALTVNSPNTNTGTVVLSGNSLTQPNIYSGPTTIFGGTLLAGATNTLSANSAVSVSAGALDVSGFANTVKSLAVGSGGTLRVGLGNVLTSANSASFAGTLSVGGTASLGSYELLGYSSETGTFATTNAADYPNYKLVYNSGELDLQHLADQSLSGAAPATINVIAGASTSISATLTNTAPSGSAALNVALPNTNGTGGMVTGLTSSTGSTVVVGTPSAVSGTFTASFSVGLSRTWSIANVDSTAVTTSASAGGAVNVYNHSNAQLSIAGGNNQSVLVNGALSAVTLTLDNTTATTGVSTPAPLDVSSSNNLSGPSGSLAVGSNSSGSYTATGLSDSTVGAGQTLSASLMAGDSATVAGHGSLSTLSQNITYNVYDHVSGSATGATIALPDSIVGYSGTLNGLANASISNASGFRVNLKTTGATSAGFDALSGNVGTVPLNPHNRLDPLPTDDPPLL